MKKEIVIKSDKGVNQISVVLFPKNQQNKVDCLRLKLKEVEGDEQFIDMTPDEVCEIIGMLATGVQFYLFEGNKEYKEILKERAKIVLKRLNK